MRRPASMSWWSRYNSFEDQTAVTWSHQIETFSVSLALCVGNPLVICGFPSQRPVMQSFDFFSLICPRINSLVNNWDTCDLRHHHTHHDITVMNFIYFTSRFHLPLPDLHVICSDVNRMIGYQDSSLSSGSQVTCSIATDKINSLRQSDVYMRQ